MCTSCQSIVFSCNNKSCRQLSGCDILGFWRFSVKAMGSKKFGIKRCYLPICQSVRWLVLDLCTFFSLRLQGSYDVQ